jgi:multiple sugar transport system permease protein
MNRRFRPWRFALYALLIGLSALFLLPLVWLVLTSLKPIDQAMTLPPMTLPRAYYAQFGGVEREVTLDYRLTRPGVIVETVRADGTKSRQFFTSKEYDALVARRGGEMPSSMTVVHSAVPGWVHVTAVPTRAERTPLWDIVPLESLASRLRPRWVNYRRALAAMGGDTESDDPLVRRNYVSFWVFLSNSLIVAVLGVIGTVLSNALVAYGFARLRWRGRDAFFAFTMATLMVPFPTLMVPLYGVFRELHWIGTLLPLWVPCWFGSAFNIFMMRQFFLSIPHELSEAARIDGCSEWKIFWRIVLPLSKPVLATAALLHFLFAWNDFLGPLLFLTRQRTYTLALALQNFQSQYNGVQWPYLMAASVVTILPIVILFFFAQKTFIRSIATTGTKG